MKTLHFIAISLMVISCRPEKIDIDVPPAEPKLVVFSHFLPNNNMVLSLSQSFSALTPAENNSLEDLAVWGADVFVEFDNKKIQFDELGYGLYGCSEMSQAAGLNYKLTAIKNNDTITSYNTMLNKLTFDEIIPVVEKTPVDTVIKIKLAFQDNPAQKNWYVINTYKKSLEPQTNILENISYFESGANILVKSILLDDEKISGIHNLDLTLDNVNHQDSIVVTLSNVSEKYYNYLELKQNSGNVASSLNLEPLNYPTNVINGYGFFNTHFPDIRSFDLSEY